MLFFSSVHLKSEDNNVKIPSEVFLITRLCLSFHFSSFPPHCHSQSQRWTQASLPVLQTEGKAVRSFSMKNLTFLPSDYMVAYTAENER